MNAVNLIPADRRGRRRGVSASPPTLALVGGLLLALVAAVVYVSAVKDVRAKRTQLARVTAASAAWNAAAARFDSTVSEVQQRSQELTDVKQLATQRFQWSQLLSQIGGLMPSHAALSSMTATTTTAATAAPAAATPTAAGSPAALVPAVQLNGCAATQAAVAQTMVQLHRVTGVSGVTLSSTTTSASGGSGASGGCPFPVQFQISMSFTAPSAAASTAAAAAPATPAGTTSTTPAASAAAPSTTGAAQ